MAFLFAVASRFLPSNNQLLTSSNHRNQATIQDGRVTVQQFQGRQSQSFASTRNQGITTTSRGNYAASQAMVVKCYNCLREGHMEKQCTQSKRYRSFAWFKEKLMLVEAQEAGQILDEEQLAFIADPGIAKVQVAQQITLRIQLSRLKTWMPTTWIVMIYPLIKQKTFVQSKEHCASLIAQINAKSVENSDLNVQLQENLFAIAALKNELRKLKGKNVIDTTVSKPSATIAPGMFKLDIVPISHTLKNNRDAYEVVKIVLLYLDFGCSKHMTRNRSHLINFVSKFLGTVKFGNDHIAKAEAAVTACYTQNISLIQKHNNETPYELLYDRKPDLSYLYVFGALCYPTNDGEDLGPGHKLMTPGTIISGLMQNIPSTSFVEEADHDIEVAYIDNIPYVNFPILEPSFEESFTHVKDNKEKDNIRAKPDKIKSKREAQKSPDSSPTKLKPSQNQESIKPRWENDPEKLGAAPDSLRGRNHRRSKQRIVNFNLEEHHHPVVTMADQRTMAQLLQAPTEGCEDAIVVPTITADNFELKHEKEPPRSIFTWDDLVSKFNNQFFPPSKTTNLCNEINNFQQRFDESFSEAWDRFKDLLQACPRHGFSELDQLDTFYNALNSKDQDSLNFVAGGNFLGKMPLESLAIIKSGSKVCYSRDNPIVAKVSTNASTSGVSPDVAELKDMVKALLLDKKGQNQSPAPVKAVEESCVTCGGAHSYRNCPATDGNVYRDNILEFVSQASAVNYNQGNTSYRPQMMSNQIRPPGFPRAQQPKCSKEQSEPFHSKSESGRIAYVKANDAVMKNMQTQGQNMQNQLTNLTNLITKFVNSNSASTSSLGTLPSNTIANPKSDSKAITTRSGVSYDGPKIPPLVVENEPEATKDTVNPTNNGNTEDVQPQAVQSKSPVSISELAIAPVSASKPNPKASIPYPSRRNDERNREKAKNQIEKFYQIFKYMSFEISFADALILMPKFALTLKALIGNKEKLSEMA
nr:reverse transcriptase domain-containing protein [Tanacetum cinerariifolium]